MSGSLFNYSPQSDGTLADVADINTPFSQVSSVLNGGIGTVNIAAKALDGSVLADSANPEVRQRRTLANYVVSGLTIATSATLSSTVLAGTAYINGKEVLPAAFPKSFTASKDTYVDLKDDGTYAFVEVVNNAPSGMTLALNTDGSNAMRIAKVVTSATAVVQVLQATFNTAPVAPNTLNWFGFDSLGNAVYNVSPYQTQIAYNAAFSTGIGTISATDVSTGLAVFVIIPANRKYRVRAKLGQGFQANGGVANIFAALYDCGASAPPAAGAAATGSQIDLGVYTSSASGSLIPMSLEAENISSVAVSKNIYVAIHSANAAVTALINTAGGSIPLTLTVDLV